MQNQQLSDVKGKELVAAGHALANAISMDTPLIEIAKMMAALATRLDCALARGDAHKHDVITWEKSMMEAIGEDGTGSVAKAIAELTAQRDALAAENAELKESVDHAAGCIHAAEVEGLQDALESNDGERLADLVHRRLCHAYQPVQTTATDAYLNSVRAEGVEMFAEVLKGKYDGIAYDLIGNYETNGEEDRISDEGEIQEALAFATQLRAGKDGE